MFAGQFVANPKTFKASLSQTGARIDWVDIAKGICIILVVMMHATLGVQSAMDQTGFMDTAIAFAKPFRMPDFFMLSGLFLAATITRPWALYLDRKVIHFAYFYVLWFVIQFSIKAPFMAMEMGVGPTIIELAKDFVNPSSTLWFIFVLPILFLLARATKNINVHLVFVLCVIASALPIKTGWVGIDQTAQYFVYFFAGYAYAPFVFRLAAKVIEQAGLTMALLAIWAICNGALVFGTGVQAWANNAESGPIHLPFISIFFGFLGSLAIIAVSAFLSQSSNLAARFLGHAGENSIAIYLSFFFPMAVARTVLIKFAPFLGAGWISLIVLIVAVISPLILFYLIGKLNLGHFLFKRPNWAITAHN